MLLSTRAVEFLELKERGRAACTCREWRIEVETPSHWPALDCRLVLRAYGTKTKDVLRRMLVSAQFGQLESLIMECCKPVSDVELKLVKADNLRALNLNALHTVTPRGVEELCARCTSCQVLSLYWHPRLDDAVLKACARSMGERLRDINLAGCGDITDAGIGALASCCRKIEKLNVTRCPKLTDDSLRYVAEGFGKHLLEFIAYADPNFSDVGYGCLANAGPSKLERLDACGARLLTSAALSAMVRRCGSHALVYLNCSWCVSLDDVAAEAVARSCRNLQLLSFHGIMGITDVGVDAIAASPIKDTLTVFDVNGCARVTHSRSDMTQMFPNVTVWIYHR